MRTSIQKNLAQTYSWKRLFYAACFLMLCVINQRVNTGFGPGGIRESFRESTGIAIACLFVPHFKMRDFIKWKVPYIVWGIAGTLGCIAVFCWGMESHPALNDWGVLMLGIAVWGYIVIYTFIQVVMEKKYPVLHKKLLAVWVIMMLWMVCSRSDFIWPFCYMVMFGCFYLTDFTKEEQTALWQGATDGIIVSFVLFQGYCCVFRPYDEVRYNGIYSNCNINALYYLTVLAAVFAKIIYFSGIEQMQKRSGQRWRLFYWLVAGAVAAFLFMTIGRTAWLTAAVLTVLFLKSLNVVSKRKRWMRNGMTFVLCILLMFPVCFSAIRYLPPVFHHPVWFMGEWAESKVHAWDPWDSEKFVDLNELLEAVLGRIVQTVENFMQHSPLLIKSDAAETVNSEEDSRMRETVLDAAQASADGLLVRGTIYRYYFTHLNWSGHPYKEQGFQLTPDFWVYHAHNIYLQYGTDFGIPVLVLFIVMLMWSCAICLRRVKSSASMLDAAAMFYILIPAIYGLIEYCWGAGTLSIAMLFVAWRQCMEVTEES